MLTVILPAVALLALLALVSLIGVVAIERLYPRDGRLIAVRGASLHVVDLGPRNLDEPAIVLLHGASCNLEAMRRPLGELLARNHRVILLDRPGHGWSDRASLQESTPSAQAAMIDEALGKLGIARAIFVAHSWAGAMLPAFALQNPDRVAGLVMLAPVTHPWDTGVAWYHTLATLPVIGPLFAYTIELPVALAMLGPGARGAFLPEPIPENYVSDTALPLLARPREFLANGWDMVTLRAAVAALRPRYGEITAPTIVIHGGTDTTVSIDIHARSFVREVASARLIELPGAGHMLQNVATDVVIGAVEQLLTARQAAAE